MARKITVNHRRKFLHLGIDTDAAPWTGALVRSLSSNVENHGPHTPDRTASLLQLFRPDFPALKSGFGLAHLHAMARRMHGYDLVLTHGERAFSAAIAHTLFAQALGLAPLVHFHDRIGPVAGGRWQRFRHRLGLTRTSAIVAPTAATGRSIARAWDVPGEKLRVIAPLFGQAGKPPTADAIPRLVKRKDEMWVGAEVDALSPLSDDVVMALGRMAEPWKLVVFGTAPKTDHLRKAAAESGLADRLLTSDRYPGPGQLAGLFDLVVASGGDEFAIPPALMPAMAAGVACVALGSVGLMELVPDAMREWVIAPGDGPGLSQAIVALTSDDDRRRALAQAGKAHAVSHGDAGAYRALFAELLDEDPSG